MQFDSLRAFPYPVLRPDVDDYLDGDIQVTVDFTPTQDGQEVTAKVSFVLSVPEINALVTSGLAKYAVVFACRDTYYRHVEQRDHADFDVSFRKGFLRGEVQVFPYVTAIAPIPSFVSASVNPEFGSGPFSFDVGSVLAVDRPQAAYIDRDVFSPLTSIFVLVKNENLTGAEWRLNTSGEKVEIQVSDALKTKIDAARNESSNRAVLVNSIYFAAVMHCIGIVKQGDVDGLRWAAIISQKAHNAGLDLDAHDDYLITERLMQFPFRLVEAYVFKGDES